MIKYVIILIFFLPGCSEPAREKAISQQVLVPVEPKTSAISEPAEPPEPAEEHPVTSSVVQTEGQEVLDLDSVWLNSVIPFSTTQEEVLKELGVPDSITTPNFECGAYIAGTPPWGDTVNIWHYQGTEIVTFRNKAELMAVKLKGEDCTLRHPRMIFSGHTTMEDVAEVFPKSVESAYEWEDVRDGQTYSLVRIAAKAAWDDEWVLKFYQGRLLEIAYWTPC